MLVDSHCHVDNKAFLKDREETIQRALEAGVSHMVAIGTGEGPPDLEAALRLADQYPCFSATVGVHPHDASKADAEIFKRLPQLLRHPKCVALGEIGLDFHYDFAPRDTQRGVFIEQLRIAADAGKPVIIHTREAWPETMEILRQYWVPSGLGCLVHCFTGNAEQAREAVSLGFYLAFGGVLTYPKAEEVREAARETPLDRILLETDAPYLPPVPYRGKRNEPAYVALTAAKLAEVRNVTLQEIAQTTAANARLLLKWEVH